MQSFLLNLIYVDELVQHIIECIQNEFENDSFEIRPTSSHKVSEVLHLLNNFNKEYLDNGNIPKLDSKFENKILFSSTFHRRNIILKFHY